MQKITEEDIRKRLSSPEAQAYRKLVEDMFLKEVIEETKKDEEKLLAGLKEIKK